MSCLNYSPKDFTVAINVFAFNYETVYHRVIKAGQIIEIEPGEESIFGIRVPFYRGTTVLCSTLSGELSFYDNSGRLFIHNNISFAEPAPGEGTELIVRDPCSLFLVAPEFHEYEYIRVDVLSIDDPPMIEAGSDDGFDGDFDTWSAGTPLDVEDSPGLSDAETIEFADLSDVESIDFPDFD